MKFTTLLTAFVASVASVASSSVETEEEPVLLNFSVDYSITQFPDITNKDVAEFTNGDQISLKYTVVNNEDKEISIVGAGGSFRDPASNEIKTNLTSAATGPIILGPGEAGEFVQNVNLNLVPDNYLLAPLVFIAYNNQLKAVPVRGQLAVVSDVPISIFNPQLLILEAILVATVGGLLYIAYSIWGKQYIEGTAPVTKPRKAASPSTPTIGQASGKSFDESWIPETHLKQKKSKKAY